MRVVRIAHPDGQQPALEFHPHLTVVEGLAADDHLQLLTALRALLSAQPIDLSAVVGVGENEIPVHGIAPLPPGAEDAQCLLTSDAFLTPVIATDEAARQALRADAEQAEEAHRDAILLQSELADALAAAQGRADRSAARSLADVSQSVADLEGQLGVDPGEASRSMIPLARDRREHLIDLIAQLEARHAWLSREGQSVVRHALAAVSDSAATEPTPSRRAEALADEWARAHATFLKVEQRLESTYGDIDQLGQRLEAARRTYEQVSVRKSNKPRISKADIALLEDAHDRVVDAESRVTGRASIYRPELIVARRAEQKILDRLGLATWAEFMLDGAFDASTGLPDRDTSLARKELDDLQRRWDGLTARLDADEELLNATAQLDRISQDAFALIGHFDDIEADLRSYQVTPGDTAHELAEHIDNLTEVLEALGFDELGDVDAEGLIQLTNDWQAAARKQTDQLHELDNARRACEAEVSRLDQILAQEHAAKPLIEDPRVDLLLSIRESAETSFDRHVGSLLETSIATERCDILERQLVRMASLAKAKRTEFEAAGKPSAWVAVDASQAVEIVQGHFDALRDATEEPLPALFDGALGELDIAAQTTILVDLMEISDGMQVIWFNPTRLMVDWASSLGENARVLSYVDITN